MKKITAIRSGRGRQKRLNISLDGKFAFSLAVEVAVKECLAVGQELNARQIEAITKANQFHRCSNAAFHYLDYRPRSESELKGRLHRRGFDDNVIDAVITKLKEQGLVDDMAFAQFWKENRQSFNPRSQRLTKVELRQKGVASDIIDRVVDVADDDDSAFRAAQDKARRLYLSDYRNFRNRLGEYLKRRGFDYGVINRVVERLWQERGERFG